MTEAQTPPPSANDDDTDNRDDPGGDGSPGPSDRSSAPSARRRGEHRWPAVAAVLVAIALYTVLPNDLLVGPRSVVPTVEILLLIPLVIVNPVRMTRKTSWSRTVSLALVFVAGAANLVSLGLLVRALVDEGVAEGRTLIVAALEVWLTNVIVFGLAYSELDRGGPVERSQAEAREHLPNADFRFSQDENDDAVAEVASTSSGKADWIPKLVDYLYVSLTNSTAFSPTDTMPLSTRAKALMGLQSVASLIVTLLVISRAVSILH